MNQLIAKFISTLLASRTQAHIFHWQAVGEDSGAKHLALGTYYEDIVGFIDALVESYQGKYGIITGFNGPSTFREDNDPLKYFTALNTYVEMSRANITQDSYIQNQVDEIVSLIETTLYKLQYLH